MTDKQKAENIRKAHENARKKIAEFQADCPEAADIRAIAQITVALKANGTPSIGFTWNVAEELTDLTPNNALAIAIGLVSGLREACSHLGNMVGIPGDILLMAAFEGNKHSHEPIARTVCTHADGRKTEQEIRRDPPKKED